MYAVLFLLWFVMVSTFVGLMLTVIRPRPRWHREKAVSRANKKRRNK